MGRYVLLYTEVARLRAVDCSIDAASKIPLGIVAEWRKRNGLFVAGRPLNYMKNANATYWTRLD